LGNRKPPLLQQVEKRLFDSLFALATNDIDLVTEMRACMSQMPWSELSAVTSESSWFQQPVTSESQDTKDGPQSQEEFRLIENRSQPRVIFRESEDVDMDASDPLTPGPRGTNEAQPRDPRRLRPSKSQSQMQQAPHTILGKRKDAPLPHVPSVKKTKGKQKVGHYQTLGSSIEAPRAIDVDKLFVSIIAPFSISLSLILNPAKAKCRVCDSE
jgi:hypothetical protein